MRVCNYQCTDTLLVCWDQAGMVSSGNSLDYTQQDMAFMLANKVAVKEMEVAAVAWVAAMFQTPMFCLKSITDIVDGALCQAASATPQLACNSSLHLTGYPCLFCIAGPEYQFRRQFLLLDVDIMRSI